MRANVAQAGQPKEDGLVHPGVVLARSSLETVSSGLVDTQCFSATFHATLRRSPWLPVTSKVRTVPQGIIKEVISLVQVKVTMG